MTIKRVGNYAVDYVLEDVRDIGGRARLMPDEFINSAGNNVTDEFYIM